MEQPAPSSEQLTAHLDEPSYSEITHVENLFIISYLTKALQDVLIRKLRFFQYPLLLIDIPLATAIFIVNLERIAYVKMLGYVLAHIRYDLQILKAIILRQHESDAGEPENWKELVFDGIRKTLRFLWGVIILLLVLPVWPLLWIYDLVSQTLLIACIYALLLFVSFSFPGGFLVYFFLLATVTFLVSSITVPFLFQLGVYFKSLFSLERKTWKQVYQEGHFAFLKFYQSLHGEHSKALRVIKTHYLNEYKPEGGVYYMLLKFLHYLKDKLWHLKEKKIEAVVETIQDKTVEFVDEYYQEKTAYDMALRTISGKDLRRTIIALLITIVFAIILVMEGSRGKGIIGPVLLSFVDQGFSQSVWVNYQSTGLGYYEDMIEFYNFLPNFLYYIALAADTVLHYFFQLYYVVAPVYLDLIVRYYAMAFNIFLTGIFYNFW